MSSDKTIPEKYRTAFDSYDHGTALVMTGDGDDTSVIVDGISMEQARRVVGALNQLDKALVVEREWRLSPHGGNEAEVASLRAAPQVAVMDRDEWKQATIDGNARFKLAEARVREVEGRVKSLYAERDLAERQNNLLHKLNTRLCELLEVVASPLSIDGENHMAVVKLARAALAGEDKS